MAANIIESFFVSLGFEINTEKLDEFEQKLQGLMKSYNKNVRDIIAILDPGPTTSKTSSAPKQRKARGIRSRGVSDARAIAPRRRGRIRGRTSR